eukprot:8499200-Pyramimonas_sp.AAC.1
MTPELRGERGRGDEGPHMRCRGRVAAGTGGPGERGEGFLEGGCCFEGAGPESLDEARAF